MATTMPPQRRSPAERAREEAMLLLSSSPLLPDRATILQRSLNLSDLFHDQIRYQEQAAVLQRLDIAQLTVQMEVISPVDDTRMVEVPVDLALDSNDGGSVDLKRSLVLSSLVESGFRLFERSRDIARNIFRDRVADAIMVRAMAAESEGGFDPPDDFPVPVDSNRQRDEILYAKGHFHSTQLHFGYSACVGYLPANRYSFGIVENGEARFHPFLVEVPLRSSPFHVPLP